LAWIERISLLIDWQCFTYMMEISAHLLAELKLIIANVFTGRFLFNGRLFSFFGVLPMRVRVFQVKRELDRLGPKKCPWSIEWRDSSSGRKRSKTIGSKRLAKEAADAKHAEIVQRSFGMVEDKPWEDFVAEYEERHIQTELRSESSRVEARRTLKCFGKLMTPKLVRSVDESMLDQYVAERRKQRGRKRSSTVSAATIRKEINTLMAALSKAKRWKYVAHLPAKPKVAGIESEKRFVTEQHFDKMLTILSSDPCPVEIPSGFEHDGSWTPADWWTAFLVTAWVTGMRRSALLALKWADVDLATGTAVSRGSDNKGKRVHRVKIGPVTGLIEQLKGSDLRVFPWDHALTWLDTQLLKIQQAAGINLPCVLDTPHECTPKCHAYSMHDFRRAHATYHYGKVPDRDLQQQMGHADFGTTRSYAKYAEAHQQAAYAYHLPAVAKAKAQGLRVLSEEADQTGGNTADKRSEAAPEPGVESNVSA
jgi:integrase